MLFNKKQWEFTFANGLFRFARNDVIVSGNGRGFLRQSRKNPLHLPQRVSVIAKEERLTQSA